MAKVTYLNFISNHGKATQNSGFSDKSRIVNATSNDFYLKQDSIDYKDNCSDNNYGTIDNCLWKMHQDELKLKLNLRSSNAIYRLISMHIPNILSQHIHFSFLLHSKRYYLYKPRTTATNIYNTDENSFTSLKNLEQSPLLALASSCKSETLNFAKSFDKLAKSPYSLLASLNNTNYCFFNIIEDSIKEFATEPIDNFILNTPRHLREHLAKQLILAGENKIVTIKKLTGLSARPIQSLQKYYKFSNIEQAKSYRSTSKLHINGLDHPARALFCNLMISFYQMGIRLLHTQKDSLPLNTSGRHYRHKISCALALGAYFAGKAIYKNLESFRSWEADRRMRFFPTFSEFYSVLELYMTMKCDSVTCNDCGTKYVYYEKIYEHWLLKGKKYVYDFKPCPYCRSFQQNELDNYFFL